jgi:tRNA pseudouridine38-40 synthase
VQAILERSIFAVTQEQVQLVGSGRTDAGAHAACQVVAFSTSSALPPDALTRAINAHLPDDVVVASTNETSSDFNPRRDAVSRTYRYLIWNRPVRSPFLHGRTAHVRRHLQHQVMDEAIRCLIGRRDMSTFIPVQTKGSRERTIYDARCWRSGELVTVQVEATGFMRQMVRAIVGTLVRVGLGHVSPAQFEDLVAAKNRTFGGDTAPAAGLYLVKLRYSDHTVESDHLLLPGGPSCSSETNGFFEEKI